MTIPNGTLVEVQVRGHCVLSNGDDQQVSNVLHIELQTPALPDAMPTITGWFNNNWFLANIQACLSDQLIMDWISARDMADDRNMPHTDFTLAGSTGSISGQRAPAGVSVQWKLETATRGRGRQGRVYFGVIPETQYVKDELTAGAQTLWNGTALNSFFQSGGITPGGAGDVYRFVILDRSSLVYTAHLLQSYTRSFTSGAILRVPIRRLHRRSELKG